MNTWAGDGFLVLHDKLMKLKKLTLKYWKALIKGNRKKESKLHLKILKKSLKGKKTQVFRD